MRKRPSKPDSSFLERHSKACVKRPTELKRALHPSAGDDGTFSHDGAFHRRERLSTPSESVPVMTSSGSGLGGSRQV